MEHYHLVMEPDNFQELLRQRIQVGEELLNRKKDFLFPKELEIEYNQYNKTNLEIIAKGFFNAEENYFYKSYYKKAQATDHKISNKERQQKNDLILKYFRNTIKFLSNLDHMVEIGDYLRNQKGEVTIRNSRDVSLKERVRLILTKLKALQSDKALSIAEIFLVNGIILSSDKEGIDLVDYLEEKGYVEDYSSTDGAFARIKPHGIEVVENLDIDPDENFSFDQINFDEKFQEILNDLRRLDMGNEVLFNELEELKELINKLDKKNWNQLLKGKLVDLGLSRIINWENAKYIFNVIVGGKLELPWS